MKQVTHNARGGSPAVSDIPEPVAKPGCVLIANAYSVISAGTEKAAMELAGKTLVGKAIERPDHVRRAVEKMKQEGLLETVAGILEKLDAPMSMGYSSAGIVLACGAGVQGFRPGDRVVSNGPHAGVVSVPANLCALAPEGVPLEQAAFAVLGSVALHGIRTAKTQLGETAFVIGLGLVGQLAVALLNAQGCRVVGTDPDPGRCALAVKMGADIARPDIDPAVIAGLTGGLGADAVLITAASKSKEPVDLAIGAVRKKGRVVLVGVAALELDRRPFYFKEAEFVVSCSYGPGRYDADYEERGHDYPAPYVRWTEQRNMRAVLDMMASGRLDTRSLVSHRFGIEQAAKAYELIEKGNEPFMAVLLEYPGIESGERKTRLELRSSAAASGGIGIGVIGAGNFAKSTILPVLAKTRTFRPRIICSAGGLNASHLAAKYRFEVVAAEEEAVHADASVNTEFILTRHDRHADQVIAALKAGKNVFVEKPLCLSVEELRAIEEALLAREKTPLLMVGFNRRFSPAASEARKFVSDIAGPLTVSVRFNAGEIPPDHWTQDELAGGGRIIGEACHAIDLASYLVGSVPVRVFAESVGGINAGRVTDDQCFITLRHANGSISNIGYLAGGDKAYSKERIEVIGGGRVAVIDNFRELTTVRNGKTARIPYGGQDKGHRAEIEALEQALTQGGNAPISWKELRAVTLASILAVRSLREGVPFDIPM